MGADIKERLPRWKTGPVLREYPGYFLVPVADIDEAAAEIGRLRASAARWKSLAIDSQSMREVGTDLDVLIAEWEDDPEFKALLDAARARRKRTPAPAMPNGVEGLVAEWEALIAHPDTSTIMRTTLENVVTRLRAYDNRDAARVAPSGWNYERMFLGAVGMLAEISVALGIPDDVAACANGNAEILEAIAVLKATPAAVPAGEAVASDDARLHAASLRGISSHLRACPPYEKLRGDADCIDAAADFILRTPQPADGEAVGEVTAKCGVRWYSRSVPRTGTKLYTAPPAPVQAAPQEGEAECPTCKAPVNTIVHARGGDWGWGTSDKERTTYRYAHHSACELGAREVATVTTTSGPYGTVGAHRVALSPEFDAWLDQQPAGTVVALQHRGDSRGGEDRS